MQVDHMRSDLLKVNTALSGTPGLLNVLHLFPTFDKLLIHTMFHDGDLTSGISRAVQERKLVACFIRADDDESSDVWEHEWLAMPCTSREGEQPTVLGDLLAAKAVVLRMTFGSQEANFLNAFTQITDAPTLVVVNNGTVVDKLEGSLLKEEFVQRLVKAAGMDAATQFDVDSAASQDGQSEVASPPPPQAIHPASTPSNTLPQPSADMRGLFPDRASRLEADKARRDAAEKAERSARALARRKEAEAAETGAAPSGTASEKEKVRRDWLYQQKQRKDEAKREKERILAQIEADKENRKARAREQKEANSATSPLSDAVDASSKRRLGAGGLCSLQIRLFDGSSIKGRFAPTTTLAHDVRKWITETTAASSQPSPSSSTSPSSPPPVADIPYTFRQILAPQPNRIIDVADEHRTLLDLDLAPSATLILVPVKGYTADAYAGGSGGYVGSALNAAYEIAQTLWSYVPGLSGGGGGDGVDSATRESGTADLTRSSDGSEMESSVSSLTGTSTPRVKTVADQRADEAAKRRSGGGGEEHREAEFYNGNSSAFEGRKGDGNVEGDGQDGTRK